MVARPRPASSPAAPPLALLPSPAPPGPLGALLAAPAEIHPALLLSWEIRVREQALGGPLPIDEQLALTGRLEQAIAAIEAAQAESDRVLHALRGAAPLPAHTVPEGF